MTWWQNDPVASESAPTDAWWKNDQVVPPDPPKIPAGGDPSVSNAMRQLPGDAGPQGQPQPTPQQQQSAPPVNPISDVAKSAGIGLVQGGIGLVTLPGNLEALGRLGIDKAAEGLGYQDPGFSKRTLLPTASDAQGAIEKYTGPFYQPQTTAGKYARTIGEFAPLAAFGGPEAGLLSRATNVVAPAVASEAAGQLTEGTAAEPWARAAGAIAGGSIPNAMMRTVTPLTNDAGRVAQVATLQNNGVTALTAGQRTGNSAVRWAESAANDLPFSGGRAKVMNDQAATQFTRSALQRAGINADRATADVIDAGFRNLGQTFDDLAARNNMRFDQPFVHDIRTAVDNYTNLTPEPFRAPVMADIMGTLDDINARGGHLSGAVYQELRSRVDRLSRSSVGSDPTLSRTLGDIRNALDDGMARHATPADAAAWGEVRDHYRNLLTIEKAVSGAGENTALGLISPSQLRTAVKGQNPRAYVRGQRDLGNLARAGEAIMKPLPNSGTPARMAAQHVLNTAGVVGGFAAGGEMGAVLGAVAPAVAQGTMGRALMSAPMQNYLANQVLAPAIEAYQPTNALARLPQAVNALSQQPTGIRGGMGPRYDANGNLLPGQ